LGGGAQRCEVHQALLVEVELDGQQLPAISLLQARQALPDSESCHLGESRQEPSPLTWPPAAAGGLDGCTTTHNCLQVGAAGAATSAVACSCLPPAGPFLARGCARSLPGQPPRPRATATGQLS
jgi:hypothetical protein